MPRVRGSLVIGLLLLSGLGACQRSGPPAEAPPTRTSQQPPGPPGRRSPANSAPTGQVADNDNLLLGNPSGATESPGSGDNYLVTRKQYVLSYNRSRGGPNWVSWHLGRADLGSVERTNIFAPDALLPSDWQIRPNDYAGTNYDRGHMCPSADRTRTPEDNAATFLMSNMLPQTGDLNRHVWDQLESHCRDLVLREQKELYICAGGYGDKESLAGGRVIAPKGCWKVIVVLPDGNNDLQRINPDTEVIAVDMPNEAGIANDPWEKYRTTIRAVEAKASAPALRLDLLSNLARTIQDSLEIKSDSGIAVAGAPKSGAVRSPRSPRGSREVWVNTRSRVYWRPGTQYYGKTTQGKFMSEADAIQSGYSPARGQ
jgi:endonuclease G